MKIFLTWFDGQDFTWTKLGSDTFEEVKIDPFVSCYLLLPDGLGDEWYNKICNSMIWNILDIPDDTHIYNWVLLPSEKDV